MSENGSRPIIIKRIRKHGQGHHGGSWKVAYADFVTAMMAFFMLLWLLGSTTEQQRSMIQGYFRNPNMMPGENGDASQALDLGGSPPLVGAVMGTAEREAMVRRQMNTLPNDAELMLDKLDQEQLEALLESLEYAIEQNPSLKAYKDQLVLDFTEEGLRIQLIDQENRPMFDTGSDELKPYTRRILGELVKVIGDVPNRISISGHTDRNPYSDASHYTNWELSLDRANAARRELLGDGIEEARIGRVVGLASMVPFDPENPFHPSNRRISITLLNRATEDALYGTPVNPRRPPQAAVQVLREKGVTSFERSS